MKFYKYSWAIIFIIFFFNTKSESQSRCIKRINKEQLYSRVKAKVSPDNGEVISRNPPILLWPATKFRGVKYKIRLSQDSSFKSKGSIISNDFPWAMFTPHEVIPNGKWYWQFAVIRKDGNQLNWSPKHNFFINAHSLKFQTPTIQNFLSSCEVSHPRLWLSKDGLREFRRRNMANPEAEQVIKSANDLLNKPLPKVEPVHIRDTSNMSPLDKSLTLIYMYHTFGFKICVPVEKLIMAYMLTGNGDFATEGIRRAIWIASLDPNGVATRDDFNSGICMETMALAYDWFYPFLTQSQKDSLLRAIKARGNQIYTYMVNNFESQLCDNHYWQEVLQEFTTASMAVVGDLKDASKWASYAYEVWSCRFPILNSNDGGWFEGDGYFSVHFATLIYLPILLRQFTGINYFKVFPWFQNLPYFMMYSFPANSASTGIGDKHESLKKPGTTWIAFANALSKEVSNPYFQSYVSALNTENPDAVEKDDKFLLFRLLNYKPDVQTLPDSGLENLQRGRLFKDVGLAVSHSYLSDANQDLMVSLYSSPFGVLGHAHASQNSININWHGKEVFSGSGYYSNFADVHNLLDYRTSRAYNTILVDSIGQSLGEDGYGWISRFMTGKRITSFVGDASNAYTGHISDFWLDKLDRRNISITKENGFGDAEVKLFRRHVITLDSNIVIIYDILQDSVPVKWTWQIHSPKEMSLKKLEANHWKISRPVNEQSSAIVNVYTQLPTTGIVHDKFNSPAVNWKGKEENGKILKYKKQWHVGVTSSPIKGERFLSIFVLGNKASLNELRIKKTADNTWTLGHYRIIAELSPSRKPSLEIIDNNGDLSFGFNVKKVSLGKQDILTKGSGASLLAEKVNNKVIVKEACDSYPVVVNK